MAGTSNGRDPGSIIGGINVTPLVDVTLVLLIIFLVTAKLVIAPAAALPLTLPKAATGEVIQVVFSVSLLKDGGLFVDGRAVASDDAIRTEAEAAHAAHPDLRAVIRADGDVPHRRVVHIMRAQGAQARRPRRLPS